MNDHAKPSGGRGGAIAALANQPIDELDQQTLERMATMYDSSDPVPEGLVERLQFACALEELHAEVADMVRAPLGLVGVRGEAVETRTATMTFSVESLTAMITVTHLADDEVRLDGWVAPGQVLDVRLRMPDGKRHTQSDATGRFHFDGLEHGFVQLSFHYSTGQDGVSVVVTPLFDI